MSSFVGMYWGWDNRSRFSKKLNNNKKKETRWLVQSGTFVSIIYLVQAKRFIIHSWYFLITFYSTFTIFQHLHMPNLFNWLRRWLTFGAEKSSNFDKSKMYRFTSRWRALIERMRYHNDFNKRPCRITTPYPFWKRFLTEELREPA